MRQHFMHSGSQLRRLGRQVGRLGAYLAATIIAASAAAEERLVDLPPFDLVILDRSNDGAVLQVEPLELPDRRIPAQRTGNLPIRLVADPTRPLEVPWANIAEVRLFEDMLFAEAKRLTEEKKFDDAFDYYARLLTEYPNLPGLNDAANDYLRRNAMELYQAQELDRALAVLASLYERAPNSPGLASAVDAICGRMIEQHLRTQDYAAARGVLEMWRQQFRTLNSQSAAAWENRFQTAAQRQLNDARRLASERKYVAARRAIARARDIWPDSDAARRLLAEIQQQNPAVSVGVLEQSPRQPVRRIDDWATLRASRLVVPLVAEMVAFSPEGGVYRSPYGEWVPDESGLRLSLRLRPAAERGPDFPRPDALTRLFLNLADPSRPEYRPEFAAVLAGVSVERDEWIHLDWTRPHVRPESLLQLPLGPLADRVDAAEAEAAVVVPRFKLADSEPGSLSYAAVPRVHGPRPWLRTVVEQSMPDDETAVAALLHGEIDVLDRVPPWQVARLRAAEGIRVDTYALPTVHVLIPNPQSKLASSREFRRALCFAIDRERIVREVMLGGADVAGYQVLSGPFPAGLSFSDPLRYAYNGRLDPRPYEPRLGAVLATVAWSKILDPSGRGNAELMQLPPLVLAHPSDPLARVACETIKLQLERAGIRVELLEFAADDLLAGNVECDLRYAELAVWEPLADARILLSADGLAGDLASPYLKTTLRQLDDATNWKDVRAKLAEIHEIAYHDLPLVPLWQTVNYLAYRTAVQGIGDSPVALYQDVERWRID